MNPWNDEAELLADPSAPWRARVRVLDRLVHVAPEGGSKDEWQAFFQRYKDAIIQSLHDWKSAVVRVACLACARLSKLNPAGFQEIAPKVLGEGLLPCLLAQQEIVVQSAAR